MYPRCKEPNTSIKDSDSYIAQQQSQKGHKLAKTATNAKKNASLIDKLQFD